MALSDTVLPIIARQTLILLVLIIELNLRYPKPGKKLHGGPTLHDHSHYHNERGGRQHGLSGIRNCVANGQGK